MVFRNTKKLRTNVEVAARMLDFGFYNMNCMDGMKGFPDDYFELAIVDPPYGCGFTENGGCKGWFSKYHEKSGEIIGGGEV